MRKTSNVVLDRITKQYMTNEGTSGFIAVNDISLEFKAGEFVTLLGPSGCGKTTILRMIAGFESPTKGEIYLDDKKINELSPDKRDTAMVFQNYALFPHYNVYDNIAFGLKLRNLNKEVIDEKVKTIMDLVGLKNLDARFPNQLSGGQQQRVSLARALIMEPAVLLFDEPLSNLDAKLRVYMRKEIRNIQKRIGLTSIYVTHDQTEAMSLSDTVIIMNNGQIEQIGTPREIYQQPASEFVADFVGTANFVDAIVNEMTAQAVTVTMLGHSVTIPIHNGKKYQTGDAVKVVVRPETIKIGAGGNFIGTITSSTFMGSFQEYSVTVNGVAFHVEEANPNGKKIFAENSTVQLTIQEDSLHVI